MSLMEMLLKKAKDPNYTLGQLFLDTMKHKPPKFICQIDAATGKSETYASVLTRSIRLAKALRNLGLKPGDVLALGGRNHIDLNIPFYAATLNGYPIVGVGPYFKYDEIKHLFNLAEPKIAFCQNDALELYEKASRELGLGVKIYTFDGDGNTFSTLMDSCTDTDDDNFQVAKFDTEKIYGWLVSTSGTTGLPKLAAFKQQILVHQTFFNATTTQATQFSPHTENVAAGLNLSPVQWISGYFYPLCMPLMNVVKVQTSKPDNIEHIIDIINEYKPVTLMCIPSTMAAILQHEKHCDLTCFRSLTVTGSKVYDRLMCDIRERLSPDCLLTVMHGQTETLGPSLKPNVSGPLGSCGSPFPPAMRLVKLVDPETEQEVTEPNVPGELWSKGPCFTEYYNNPMETAKAFSEDGWFKTGDLMYKDENDNYFSLDRTMTLIKTKNNSYIAPPEIEVVIMTHEGVQEVAVVGIPHETDGQRPAACVVRQPGCDVTAQEIKNLVKHNLPETKQLRGGVIFLDSLPKTSTGKIARKILEELVLNLPKE